MRVKFCEVEKPIENFKIGHEKFPDTWAADFDSQR